MSEKIGEQMSEAKVTARKEIVEGILGTYENCISRGNGHQQSKQQAIAWLDASEGRLEAALAARPKAWTLEEIKAAFRRTTPGTAEYELQLAVLLALREAVRWKPITPDSLPKVGDEVYRAGMNGCKPALDIQVVGDATTTYNGYREWGWTHYRAINPPSAEGSSEEAIDAEKRAQPAESQPQGGVVSSYYAAQLQQLIENLKYPDTPPPHAHLWHHKMIVEAKQRIAEGRREGIEEGKQERTEEILQYCDEMVQLAAAAYIRAKFLPQPTLEETLKKRVREIVDSSENVGDVDKQTDAIMAEFDKVIAQLKGGTK